jgi:molybdate transport system substrate-binding protein
MRLRVRFRWIARDTFPFKAKGAELTNNASRTGLVETTRRRLGRLPFGLAIGAVIFTQSMVGGADTATAAPDTAAAPVVFAAASMKTALDAVAAAWKADTGKTVSIAYASSAVLAKQIEQGAPADIFISADLKWMDYLEKAKLIRVGTRRNLLGNKLVLIEPSDADVKLEIAKGFDLAGAGGDGKIAVCMIDSCPAGIYAKETLVSLGVFAGVEPKLAQADNVRNALNLVSRGEAKFGIVYATDAKADPKVKVVGTFPASSHSPIVYPIALVAASANPDAAFFLAYLTSQAANQIFLEQGFEVLSK